MDFSLTDEQQMIIATLKAFVEQELYPHEAEVEKTNTIRPELYADIKQKAMQTLNKKPLNWDSTPPTCPKNTVVQA